IGDLLGGELSVAIRIDHCEHGVAADKRGGQGTALGCAALPRVELSVMVAIERSQSRRREDEFSAGDRVISVDIQYFHDRQELEVSDRQFLPWIGYRFWNSDRGVELLSFE